jgi:hypothetical protein
MPSEANPAGRRRQDIPTLYFIYSTTDDLAFDCKRLETMRLSARLAYRQTYYSLYWVIDGSATAGIDFVDYPLLPSTLTLLQPGQVFYPHVSTPLHGLAMYFPRDFLALELLGSANPFPLISSTEKRLLAPLEVNREQTPQIHHLTSAIADEFAGNQSGRDTMVRAAVVRHPGGPDALQFEEMPRPELRSGWVSIRVKAFGLSRSELYARRRENSRHAALMDQKQYSQATGGSPLWPFSCRTRLRHLAQGRHNVSATISLSGSPPLMREGYHSRHSSGSSGMTLLRAY